MLLPSCSLVGVPLVKLSIVGNICKEKTKRDKLNYFFFLKNVLRRGPCKNWRENMRF